MKILRYFFYVLLIVFILFLGTGLFVPTLNYEAEVSVNKPVATCWKIFTDTTKMGEWVHNFKSIEVLNETSDKVGSRYLLTVEDGGEEYQMTETVLSYDPEKYYAFQIENDVLINHVEFTFESKAGNTKIVTTNKLKGKDILMKAIFPFMKGMFTREAKGDLERLKTLIERS